MEIFSTDNLISLLTLTLMEIVLGIDNIVFISIVAGKLPESLRPRARSLGLLMALLFRVALLFSISWIIQLKNPITLFASFPAPFDLSWRDIILISGGGFLMVKTILEMHHKLEGEENSAINPRANNFWQVVAQIIALDIVFSFDSILTAVGLVSPDKVWIMITAVVISLGIMLLASGSISRFINERPTMKMLALAFLLLIGFMLIAEGFDQHIEKGYIYFAMAFSFGVELLNNRLKHKKEGAPVKLRERIQETEWE